MGVQIPLVKWTKQDYFKFIRFNYLHQFFIEHTNPTDQKYKNNQPVGDPIKEGQRFIARIPNYPALKGIDRLEVPHKQYNPRRKCEQTLTFNPYKHLYICHNCDDPDPSHHVERYPFYRWKRADPKSGKATVSTWAEVLRLAPLTRTWYYSLGVWAPEFFEDVEALYQPGYLQHYTLGLDCDIVKGMPWEDKNRAAMQKAHEIIMEDLNTFVPGSVNLQGSGKGWYYLLHHELLSTKAPIMSDKRTDYFNYMLRQWTKYSDGLKQKVEHATKGRIEIDSKLNDAARVFKLPGSIHQREETVAIPFPIDINFLTFDLEQMKLKNFRFVDYRDKNERGEWITLFYNRLNKCERGALKKRMDELPEYEGEEEKHRLKAVLANEGITAEPQTKRDPRGKAICAGVEYSPEYTRENKIYRFKDRTEAEGISPQKAREHLKKLKEKKATAPQKAERLIKASTHDVYFYNCSKCRRKHRRGSRLYEDHKEHDKGVLIPTEEQVEPLRKFKTCPSCSKKGLYRTDKTLKCRYCGHMEADQ